MNELEKSAQRATHKRCSLPEQSRYPEKSRRMPIQMAVSSVNIRSRIDKTGSSSKISRQGMKSAGRAPGRFCSRRGTVLKSVWKLTSATATSFPTM